MHDSSMAVRNSLNSRILSDSSDIVSNAASFSNLLRTYRIFSVDNLSHVDSIEVRPKTYLNQPTNGGQASLN